jgi:hypothetical protein
MPRSAMFTAIMVTLRHVPSPATHAAPAVGNELTFLAARPASGCEDLTRPANSRGFLHIRPEQPDHQHRPSTFRRRMPAGGADGVAGRHCSRSLPLRDKGVPPAKTWYAFVGGTRRGYSGVSLTTAVMTALTAGRSVVPQSTSWV